MSFENEAFNKIIATKLIRLSVRSLCFHDDKILVQRPTDDPDACYGTIGGRLELGESLEDRIRREYEEETNARVTKSEYLFVIENRFRYNNGIIHLVEHFFLVELDKYEIDSHERHICQHWLPVEKIKDYDFRPHILRDAIADGSWRHIKHLIVPFN